MADRLSSTIPPSYFDTLAFSIVAVFTCFPNNMTEMIAIGKKEIQIPAKTGPLYSAIPIPAKHTTSEYSKLPTFSPIADCMMAKFSPI